jgi:hypothetical protein
MMCADAYDPQDAVALLEPLTKDPVDFVRQGACISLAMILVQQNETTNPKVAPVRKIFEKIVGDKHEDAMAKFGAALSQGIIDAGGRNVTISMQNKSGNNNMPAIVGMALFTQFWYWFPLGHLLSLSFTPTAIIGVNENLQVSFRRFPLDDVLTTTRHRSPSSTLSRTPVPPSLRTHLRPSRLRRRLSRRSPRQYCRRPSRRLLEPRPRSRLLMVWRL